MSAKARRGLAGATSAFLSAAIALGCEPKPPEPTGGVQVEESLGSDGRSCGRGIAVAMIDPDSYASTNVALVGLDGATLSGSFVSSASVESSLNAALSGDVVFPTGRMAGDIVLIDRLVSSVITFVDVKTAEVTGQVPVRTGFEANPQDFVLLGDGSALVSRLEKNSDPKREPFDEGDDLLRLDPSTGSILFRIDLSAYASDETGRARPTALVRNQAHVFASLTRHSSDFQEADESGLLVLDAETAEFEHFDVVSGLKNCGGMALSADGRRLALSCGGLVKNSNGSRPEFSGVVVFDLTESDGGLRLTETFRVEANELGVGPLSPSVTFASDELLWVIAYGALEGEDAGRPDRLLSFSLESGSHEVLLESSERAFTLGDVRCVAPCGVCFAADAGRGVLHRFPVVERTVSEATVHVVESDIGLPPLLLGWF